MIHFSEDLWNGAFAGHTAVWPICVRFRFTRDTLSAPSKKKYNFYGFGGEKRYRMDEEIWFMGIL